MAFVVGDGPALRVEGGSGRARGAGGAGALAGAERGGPGPGGAVVAGRRDGGGDRPPARRARRHGACLARLVQPLWHRRAAAATAFGATGHAGRGSARLRDDDPRRGPDGVDAAAVGGRDRAADRGDDLDRAAERAAAAKGGFAWRRPRHTLRGRQDAEAVERAGVRLALRRQQARAGDIDLLFVDESEALTHPYLAHAWTKRGTDLRVEAPGQAKKRALLGALDHATGRLVVATSATKRSADFIALLATLERTYAPPQSGGRPSKPLVLVLDNGPIHTSKATTQALAARSAWLTVEWLPKYAPELNDIERCWRDLKRHHLANRSFDSVDHLDQEIHRAVHDRNQERAKLMCPNLRRAA
jgi:transposase